MHYSWLPSGHYGIENLANLDLLPAKGAGTDDILAKEKLCPVVTILPYQEFDAAVANAKANLIVEGAGHSAAVHSNDEAHIREAGLELPISRNYKHTGWDEKFAYFDKPGSPVSASRWFVPSPARSPTSGTSWVVR